MEVESLVQRIRNSSSQKPEVYNQHFPTLSDDEEKRLDQYTMAIRGLRNVDSRGKLSDFVRLAVRSKRRGSLRSSLLNLLVREYEIIQARIHEQAPKEVVECAYRDSMVEEVFAVWQA